MTKKKTIRVSEDVFDRAKAKKDQLGVEWDAYIDPKVAAAQGDLIQHACEQAIEVKIPDRVLDA